MGNGMLVTDARAVRPNNPSQATPALPNTNLELLWVLNDGHKLLHLILRELAGPFVRVNLRLLTDKVGKPPADAANRGEREHHLI